VQLSIEQKFLPTLRNIFAKPSAFDDRSRASWKWTLNWRQVCMIVCLHEHQQQTTTMVATTAMTYYCAIFYFSSFYVTCDHKCF